MQLGFPVVMLAVRALARQIPNRSHTGPTTRTPSALGHRSIVGHHRLEFVADLYCSNKVHRAQTAEKIGFKHCRTVAKVRSKYDRAWPSALSLEP